MQWIDDVTDRGVPVCIDAVGHGDRLPDGDRQESEAIAAMEAAGKVNIMDPEFLAVRRKREPITDATFEAMAADSSATLDEMLKEVGDVPVGYAGFSMGSIYGTAVVAAEPRITAGALGLSGIVAPGSATKSPMANLGDRLAADSARITCPLLFLVQHDDEAVPYDAAYRQFDTFASVHKRMHVNTGLHMHVPTDETPFVELFLATQLLGESRRARLVVQRRIPVES